MTGDLELWKHFCRERKGWWTTWLDNCDVCAATKPLFPQLPGVDYPDNGIWQLAKPQPVDPTH